MLTSKLLDPVSLCKLKATSQAIVAHQAKQATIAETIFEKLIIYCETI